MNMDACEWPQLFALFERIADAPRDERQRMLGAATRERPDLHAHIERLLALDASDGDFVGEVAGWREQWAQASAGEPLPTRIGAWKIVRELGAGGMAECFSPSAPMANTSSRLH